MLTTHQEPRHLSLPTFRYSCLIYIHYTNIFKNIMIFGRRVYAARIGKSPEYFDSIFLRSDQNLLPPGFFTRFAGHDKADFIGAFAVVNSGFRHPIALERSSHAHCGRPTQKHGRSSGIVPMYGEHIHNIFYPMPSKERDVSAQAAALDGRTESPQVEPRLGQGSSDPAS